jgi:hypothetical protein
LILLYKVEWCVWTEVGVICRIQVWHWTHSKKRKVCCQAEKRR